MQSHNDHSSFGLRLSAKGETIERKSHQEANSEHYRDQSPHTRRKANLIETARNAIRNGKIQNSRQEDADYRSEEFKEDQKKPKSSRRYTNGYATRIKHSRQRAVKAEKKQDRKLANVLNDVDYHLQHNNLNHADHQEIHGAIAQAKKPAVHFKSPNMVEH